MVCTQEERDAIRSLDLLYRRVEVLDYMIKYFLSMPLLVIDSFLTYQIQYLSYVAIKREFYMMYKLHGIYSSFF